jgi:hypothetical protein
MVYVRRLACVAAVAATAACSGDATAPGAVLTDAEVSALAVEFGGQALALGTVDAPAGASADVLGDQVTRSASFSVERSCPNGGTVRFQGTRTGVGDAEARTWEITLDATRTHDACSFRGRRESVIVTRTGAIRVEGRHFYREGRPEGVQTQRQHGSFEWSTSDGRAGTCEVDLTSERDPATRTHRVFGSFCGRTIDRTMAHR